ncbi:DUF6512 family protein [Desulfuribacillus alkaliarsenatis]|uniref:Uncharacterized protein n=1 Tax=Desulfuribacillus alkaliarsenatis TaxID=766136 RepID=A0A1E5G3F2_9FIRM|nr:DUF6512 family protein [Desulfuribacillus alkaliarsenatis]OEF97500.1 hypothetical protein BHF68_04655 [Desulfuribacillus alkaliarsenatis]
MLTFTYIIIKSIVFLFLYTLFHFAHDYVRWPIFAISESIWEHLKIAYYVAILLAVGELFVVSVILDNTVSVTSLLFTRLIGALLVVPIIFLFFYFMYAAFGVIKHKVIKVVSVVTLTWAGGLCAYYFEVLAFQYPIEQNASPLIILVVLALMLLFLFVRFTKHIPKYPVFEEVVIKR